MNFEIIKMEIACNPQYVSVVRLTTSGIANKMGFCLDDIEDIKKAKDELLAKANELAAKVYEEASKNAKHEEDNSEDKETTKKSDDGVVDADFEEK